jgi:hypothetical protein
MLLFPIGTVAAASNAGTINSVSYNFFEPNLRCKSSPVFSVLSTKFEQQTSLVRKKAEPYLVISYDYENIFAREYLQIEHFVYTSADGGNASFYVVDFSKGITPSSVTDSGGDWVIAITNTRLFSILEKQKAHKVFITDGSSWKEGDVIALTNNTSITADVDTNNYGALSVANANSYGMIFPMYECYTTENVLNNFNTTTFVDETINTVNDGGWMYSGTIGFMSKYKV